MNKVVLILIISQLAIVKLTFSQTEIKTVNLHEYEIIDTSLMRVIDEFLIAETDCSYFSDSSKLSLNICDWNGDLSDNCHDSDTLSVMISSIGYSDLFFFNAVGFINYSGHKISIANVATNKFFKETGKTIEFTYIDSKEIRISSRTYWTFRYCCNRFNLTHEKYNCSSSKKKE